MTDAVVLAVVVPMVGGILSLLTGLYSSRSGWWVALGTSVVETYLAVRVGTLVASSGRVTYSLGGFSPPAGIELVADGLSSLLLGVVAVVSLGVLAYSRHAGPRGNSFYSVYLLLTGGISGLVLTGDLFNMYVFLEITGLAAYAVVASGDSPDSAVASLKYLIVGTVGASLFLLGVGYIYVATGTLNMADAAEELRVAGYGSRLVVTSFGLVLTGLLVKAAVFPLHPWQPDAYADSPHSVTALISALVSTSAVYALVRVVYTVYTVEFFEAVPTARRLMVYLGVVSIVAGGVLALLQEDVKRMLAYSSVSQYGIIVAGFGAASRTAAVGGVVYLVGHAFLKGGAFAAAGAVSESTGRETIEEYAGLSEKSPVAAAGLGLLALGLIGVPPGPGFVGKWYMVLGALESESWLVAGGVGVSTLVSLAYLSRLIERVYLREPVSVTSVSKGSVSVGMLAVVVTSAVVGFGIGPAGTVIGDFVDPVFAEVFGA